MSESVIRVLLVALGGAIGSLGRYFLSGFVGRTLASAFPWGTISVNLLGSLLFGLIWAMLGRDVSNLWKVFLLGGCLGAFTTFSTFMFETVQLWEKGRPLAALSNVLLQNVAGVICVFVGLALGDYLHAVWSRGA